MRKEKEEGELREREVEEAFEAEGAPETLIEGEHEEEKGCLHGGGEGGVGAHRGGGGDCVPQPREEAVLRREKLAQAF